MTVISVIATILLVLAALVLIATVLLQPGETNNLGAIAGGAETFFGAGKATAADKVFARLTSVVGVIFVIVALVLNLVH